MLGFTDSAASDENSSASKPEPKRAKQAPVRKKAATGAADRKKPAKESKSQEDVYRNFADASAGDCGASRRKLPHTPAKDEERDIEWF